MIELIWQPPHKEPGVKRPPINRNLLENFKYYGNWGFTIYRTYYSPESDKHWDMLLDALKRQTYFALAYLEDEDQYRHNLREVCLSEEPEAEKTIAGSRFRFVLIANESVLRDIAKGEFVMRILTGYLLELWHSLMMTEFNLCLVLWFEGLEEDLEEYIWPGEAAASPTSCCSEIQPGLVHYSA
ncbi:hypothetical protein B0J13DRAFT_586379 [Dactylonectria estremocensis]|uniref:Uncharacterized protein n=1 Tax=Dactylonectria estremocensis TaxID=1079267 RepID=A0A9P9EMK1_9HYPO|nr:hypothetical protein B0J13DRAFT_586379 [Dactylonectria estremocensis]